MILYFEILTIKNKLSFVSGYFTSFAFSRLEIFLIESKFGITLIRF